jgi:hypothetical protein
MLADVDGSASSTAVLLWCRQALSVSVVECVEQAHHASKHVVTYHYTSCELWYLNQATVCLLKAHSRCVYCRYRLVVPTLMVCEGHSMLL